MTVSPVPWSLTGSRINLACGQLAAEFDLRDLVMGVHGLNWAGSPLDACVLGPQVPRVVNGQFAVTECYVRGADLVVSCERPAPLPLVPQFYWRARQNESPAAVGIELIISMRTDLLDSEPQSLVLSSLRCDEVLSALRLEVDTFRAASPGTLKRVDLAGSEVPAYLFRHARGYGRKGKDAGVSYFQMVHPDDFFATECGVRRKYRQVVTKLFPERLEKGVIRRARICGWFLPAENDLAVAVELAKQFIDEPLPLTT